MSTKIYGNTYGVKHKSEAEGEEEGEDGVGVEVPEGAQFVEGLALVAPQGVPQDKDGLSGDLLGGEGRGATQRRGERGGGILDRIDRIMRILSVKKQRAGTTYGMPVKPSGTSPEAAIESRGGRWYNAASRATMSFVMMRVYPKEAPRKRPFGRSGTRCQEGLRGTEGHEQKGGR